MQIFGEKNADYLDGIPCDTGILDHVDVSDYGGNFNSWARFDGSQSQEEKNMMGSCYQVSPEINFKTPLFIKNCLQGPLNAQISGGWLTWVGDGEYEPMDVCIDWISNNFAWLCRLAQAGPNSNTWNFTDCQDLLLSQYESYENCTVYYVTPHATP